MSNDRCDKAPSLTIVACIESGILEPLTIRMVDSLRRFGGRFANVDVVAVTPRLSPPLSEETTLQMKRLGIQHIKLHTHNPYSWHHYTNKPEALAAVESEVTTEAVAWIDSDIIFLKPPDDLELPNGVDFLACASDTGMLGSTGGNDPHDQFWQRAAAVIGRKADDLPWLVTADGHRIRFYWNAGLFVYRRDRRFGKEFLSDLRSFLDRRVATTHLQVHAMDQVVLGLTAIRLGLNWKELPESSNFPVCSFLPKNYDPSKVTAVNTLHFHDSMTAPLWTKLLSTIAPGHPEIHSWLAPQGPAFAPPSRLNEVAREALRLGRGARRRIYYMRSGFTKNSRQTAGHSA